MDNPLPSPLLATIGRDLGRRSEEVLCSQELKEARSILNFCREQGRFPDLPGREPSRAPSPTPSQRSHAASLVGNNLPTSPASAADAACAPAPTRLLPAGL